MGTVLECPTPRWGGKLSGMGTVRECPRWGAKLSGMGNVRECPGWGGKLSGMGNVRECPGWWGKLSEMGTVRVESVREGTFQGGNILHCRRLTAKRRQILLMDTWRRHCSWSVLATYSWYCKVSSVWVCKTAIECLLTAKACYRQTDGKSTSVV